VHDVAGRFSVVLFANENPAPVTVLAGSLVTVAASAAVP
jgi:hypothetical protein